MEAVERLAVHLAAGLARVLSLRRSATDVASALRTVVNSTKATGLLPGLAGGMSQRCVVVSRQSSSSRTHNELAELLELVGDVGRAHALRKAADEERARHGAKRESRSLRRVRSVRREVEGGPSDSVASARAGRTGLGGARPRRSASLGLGQEDNRASKK